MQEHNEHSDPSQGLNLKNNMWTQMLIIWTDIIFQTRPEFAKL